MAYNYAFAGNNDFETFVIREHGAIYEMFLVAMEKATGKTEKGEIFFLRHLLNHLTFLLGAWFFFLTVDLIYRNKFLAATGFLLVVLHPVIYGHSFFNSKDLPFLSLMMIAFYLFVKVYDNAKLWNVAALAFMSGLLVSIRLTGLMFIALTGFYFLVELIRSANKKQVLINGMLYLVISILSLCLCWPLLWKDPVGNFLWVFSVMAKYPFEGLVLFEGEMIVGNKLPWYYLIKWFCISTPLVFLVAGVSSILLVTIGFFQRKKDSKRTRLLQLNLFFTAAFVMPVLSILVLHSVIYDGWRHMFFIYPPFALVAVFVVYHLMQLQYKKIIAAAVLCAFLPTVYFMLRNHPLQFVFFNALVNRNEPEYLRHQYELDYWGVAYKQGLETILKYDTSSHIKISSQNPPCDMNLELLPKEQRQRFSFAVIDESDYFLTNYRWHPEDYSEPALLKKEWRSVIVQNSSINMIYKIKK